MTQRRLFACRRHQFSECISDRTPPGSLSAILARIDASGCTMKYDFACWPPNKVTLKRQSLTVALGHVHSRPRLFLPRLRCSDHRLSLPDRMQMAYLNGDDQCRGTRVKQVGWRRLLRNHSKPIKAAPARHLPPNKHLPCSNFFLQ